MINASGKGYAEAPETRAFADHCRKMLVLSRTNGLELRAFADLRFVLLRTNQPKIVPQHRINRPASAGQHFGSVILGEIVTLVSPARRPGRFVSVLAALSLIAIR